MCCIGSRYVGHSFSLKISPFDTDKVHQDMLVLNGIYSGR